MQRPYLRDFASLATNALEFTLQGRLLQPQVALFLDGSPQLSLAAL